VKESVKLNELTNPVVCYGCRMETCYPGKPIDPNAHCCNKYSAPSSDDDFEEGYDQGVLEVLSELDPDTRNTLIKKFHSWKILWEERKT
jgi:hypothetical protein